MQGARRGARFCLGMLALAAIPALAQERDSLTRPANLPPGAVVQPLDDGAGEELRRHLGALNENPRSVSALIGAGRAALDMGDADAALTFFARADELAPRDARSKAGMAAAMARLEQAQAALSLFAEAVQLGAPEVEIAGDRGLAHDTVGDTAAAQRDYALVLRRRDDPEIRRRMALSLGISGQREAALRMIDGQLRANNRAAWRTQAFVLAMTGDTAGANRAAASVMPPGAAQAMAPFLARLAALSPAQKALAVHFGHFPSDGRVSTASTQATADPGALALAQSGVPAALPTRTAEPVSTAPRRRPGPPVVTEERVGIGLRPPIMTARQRQEMAARDAARERRASEVAQLDTRRTQPPQPSPSPPPAAAPPPATRFQPNAPGSAITATAIPASTFGASPGFSLTPGGDQPDPAPAEASPPVVSVAARPFADIAALVDTLQEERVTASPPAVSNPPASPALTDRQIRDALARERERAARAAAPPRPTPPAASTRTAARTTAPATNRPRAAQPAHPSRHWVQVAGGANRAGLPREFARLRGLAPALLNGRAAYTTPLNATNRLLVGPFASTREAQAFVNQLGERDISAFAWTSPAGQEVDRLQIGR